MAKRKKGPDGDIVVVNFTKAGHEVARDQKLGFGEALEVNLPAVARADLEEKVDLQGLKIIRQSTHIAEEHGGQPMRRFLLFFVPGAKQGVFKVTHRPSDPAKPPVFSAILNVQGPG